MVNKNYFVGMTGVYYAAAELSSRGLIVAATSRNAPGPDIVITSPNGTKSINIQVKTSGAEQRERFTCSWQLDEKDENRVAKNLFYIFVDLWPGNKKPDFYIVPSKTVATYIKRSHAIWLKKRGLGGKKHKENPRRLYEIYDNATAAKYLNKWKNLGL